MSNQPSNKDAPILVSYDTATATRNDVVSERVDDRRLRTAKPRVGILRPSKVIAVNV